MPITELKSLGVKTKILPSDNLGNFHIKMPFNELTPEWKAFGEKAGSLRGLKYRLHLLKAFTILQPTKKGRKNTKLLGNEIESIETDLKKLFNSKSKDLAVVFHENPKVNSMIRQIAANRNVTLTVFNKSLHITTETPLIRHHSTARLH